MPAIISNNIKSADYDERGLVVVFHSGKEYTYPGVPRELYEDLLVAESAGRYLNSQIKPFYPHKPEVKESGL